jgi:hypothetical protein
MKVPTAVDFAEAFAFSDHGGDYLPQFSRRARRRAYHRLKKVVVELKKRRALAHTRPAALWFDRRIQDNEAAVERLRLSLSEKSHA